jgi:hypothetical protein
MFLVVFIMLFSYIYIKCTWIIFNPPLITLCVPPSPFQWILLSHVPVFSYDCFINLKFMSSSLINFELFMNKFMFLLLYFVWLLVYRNLILWDYCFVSYMFSSLNFLSTLVENQLTKMLGLYLDCWLCSYLIIILEITHSLDCSCIANLDFK